MFLNFHEIPPNLRFKVSFERYSTLTWKDLWASFFLSLSWINHSMEAGPLDGQTSIKVTQSFCWTAGSPSCEQKYDKKATDHQNIFIYGSAKHCRLWEWTYPHTPEAVWLRESRLEKASKHGQNGFSVSIFHVENWLINPMLWSMEPIVAWKNLGKCVISPLTEHRREAIFLLLPPLSPRSLSPPGLD